MYPRPIIEGFFVKTVEDLVFEIKGVLHPKDRYIAYLRYVPSDQLDGGFTKIYNLVDRQEFLSNRYPTYLWSSEVHGRVVQSVPHERVVQIFDPVEHLSLLRSGTKRMSALEEKSAEMAEILVKHTSITWTSIGLTGSLLVGNAREDSDIDLVVYGEHSGRSLYKRINRCPVIERYTGSELERHVEFRWGKLGQDTDVLAEIEQQKRLQGTFNGSEYFIRLVKHPQESAYRFGDRRFDFVEHLVCECTIMDDQHSIFTPCVYDVESASQPSLRQIVSFRGRFTEHVHTGDRVNVRGRMERVTEKQGRIYTRIVVGESPHDYLLPL